MSWALRHRATVWRWAMLGTSWAFYAGWNARFVLLLAGSAVINHALVMWMDRQEGTRRKLVLVAGLVVHLGALAAFKYADLFLRSVEAASIVFGAPVRLPLVEMALPVGLSFFTFEAISYAVDVYRKDTRPVSWVDSALYMAWFPHLVAGPLVRIRELVPQFDGPVPVGIPVGRAARLLVGGLVCKVWIADTLATRLVDPVFARPEEVGAEMALIGILGYSVQILCDFSAYTDMAQGLSLLMGIQLPDNFRQPYRAQSFQDFWRRWHMSLSRWLRDYLYVPLGGSRGSKTRTYLALCATMLLGGLWHGADGRFLLWGAIHGLFLVIERALGLARPPSAGPRGWMRMGVVFALTSLAWVPFRAPSIESAGVLLSRLGTPQVDAFSLDPIIGCAIAVPLLLQVVPEGWLEAVDEWLDGRPPWAIAFAAAMAMVVIDALGPEGVAAFLYYEF